MFKQFRLSLICAGVLFSVGTIDAGTIKGYVYDINGTVLKTPAVQIKVYKVDLTTGAKVATSIGSGNSLSDGSFTVTFDSTQVSAGGHVLVELNRSTTTTKITTVRGTAKDGTTDIFTGGLLGNPSVIHTIHVVVP